MFTNLFENLLESTRIDELTQAGIVRKQQSITRLFPDFQTKVRGIASKGGLRLVNLTADTWHFKIHSGTQNNLWYDTHLHFKDMNVLLSNLVKDRRLWTKDKKHIDLKKLAKKVMFDADIQTDCSCPAQLYWGGDYILSLSRYDAKFGDRENRPPRIRNPRQFGAVCKHLQNLLNVFPWYVSTTAKWLNDYHKKQIDFLEKESNKEKAKFTKRGEDLGKKKEEAGKKADTKESILNRKGIGGDQDCWLLPSGSEIPVKDNHILDAARYLIKTGALSKKRSAISYADDDADLVSSEMGERSWIRISFIKEEYLSESTVAVTMYSGKISQAQIRKIKEWSEIYAVFLFDLFDMENQDIPQASGEGFSSFMHEIRKYPMNENNVNPSDLFQPWTPEEIKGLFIQNLKDQGCFQNPDETWSSKGDVDISGKSLKVIPVQFKEVGGDFWCGNNKLTSLQGCPKEVGGGFGCGHNQLTSLQGCPKEVGGGFGCAYNKLTSLQGCPKEVGGDFWCRSNKKMFTEAEVRKFCKVGGGINV
jgi:hypothetical protein